MMARHPTGATWRVGWGGCSLFGRGVRGGGLFGRGVREGCSGGLFGRVVREGFKWRGVHEGGWWGGVGVCVLADGLGR